MKRVLLVIIVLLIAAFAAAFFFIPADEFYTSGAAVNSSSRGLYRFVLNEKNTDKWLPGNKINDSVYNFQNCNYKINKILLNGIDLTVSNNTTAVRGFLEFVSAGSDSAQIIFSSRLKYTANPVLRLLQYIKTGALKKNVSAWLQQTKNYLGDEKNIYGMKIEKRKVTDSSLISTMQVFNHYPDANEIYNMIGSLKSFIKEKGGEQTGSPMLHVHGESSTVYQAMVAIPVKRDIPAEKNFRVKKMVLGNILMGEVKGGIATVINAERELDNYVKDHQKMSPAIPFQSLVTDRSAEPDTLKWVTRLYYPVFN